MVINSIKINSDNYFDETYSENTEIGDSADFYIAVLVGEEYYLPWSSENVGLTFSSSEESEFGSLALITMNYDEIFEDYEGLTQITLHEIGHLIGLNHPHDYWDTNLEKVIYSWIWGYTMSPMTYITSGYSWDYFDKELSYRIQISSLLRGMDGRNYFEREINDIFIQLRHGYTNYLALLEETTILYGQYLNRDEFHHLFTSVLLLSVGLTFIIILSVTIKKYIN